MAPTPYEQQWVDSGIERLGLHLYPDPGPAAPAAVLWPAMGVPAGFYRPLATSLGEAGLAVTVADLRGTGTSRPPASPRSRYGYAELVDDVGTVLAALKPRLYGRRVMLMGHSLGGQACLLHLALAGAPEVDRLALVAVGVPYWRSYGRSRWGVLAFTQSIHAAAHLLRVWPGWGFGGRQARGVIRDWAYTSRTGAFPTLSGVDTEAAIAALRMPVFAASLQRDQYTPAPAVDHLVGKLTAAAVQRAHYDGTADHFTWARDPAGPIAARLAAFAHER